MIAPTRSAAEKLFSNGNAERIAMMELKVGSVYTAPNQGTSITPRSIEVTIVWLDGDNVHYRIGKDHTVHQTPRARFLEIISAERG